MIEKFNQIGQFNPEFFQTRTEDQQKEIMQNFMNFLCKQSTNNLSCNIVLEDCGTDLGRYNSDTNTIIINKIIFNKYNEFIKDPNSQNLSNSLKEKLKNYPFQLCSTIVHETTHACQNLEYTKIGNNLYANIQTPLTNDNLYFLQKTEREAFQNEINEMKNLYDYFKKNDFLDRDTLQYLHHYILDLQDDLNNGFQKSMYFLNDNNIVSNKTFKSHINSNELENIKEYHKIQEMLERETEFAKDRQDFYKNESLYIHKEIMLENNKPLIYNIRNDNGKWFVKMQLDKKQNTTEINFSLDIDIPAGLPVGMSRYYCNRRYFYK